MADRLADEAYCLCTHHTLHISPFGNDLCLLIPCVLVLADPATDGEEGDQLMGRAESTGIAGSKRSTHTACGANRVLQVRDLAFRIVVLMAYRGTALQSSDSRQLSASETALCWSGPHYAVGRQACVYSCRMAKHTMQPMGNPQRGLLHPM